MLATGKTPWFAQCADTGVLGGAFSALAGMLGLRASPVEVHVVFDKVVDA